MITDNATPQATGTPIPTPAATDDDNDDDETFNNVDIVIEGPVTAINVTIITIYNISIQVNPDDDDILNDIEIGDILRVEGNFQGSGNTIIVVAVNITIVNIQVNVSPGGGQPGGQPGGGGDDDDD